VPQTLVGIDSNRDGSGVLGVGIDFSGLVLGAIAGKEFVDIAASFDVVRRMYV
jgi:hypothetical protein